MENEMKIRKWGNSHGILIDRKTMRNMHVSVDDRLRVVSATEDRIVLEHIIEQPKNLVAAGMLRHYADDTLRKKEKQAFADAVKEKYGDAH